jgi:hypothetical protein
MKLANKLVLALYAASALYAADPTGESILDRYIEVTGGRAAYGKVRNRITVAKMEFVGKGITANMTMTNGEGMKSHIAVDIPSVAKMEQGTDGTIAWERSALKGPRLKSGGEKAIALRGADLNADLNWRKYFSKAEYTGTEPVEGKICHRVSLTAVTGGAETRYYDKDSGLMVRTSQVVNTEMGDIPSEMIVTDYRSVDGILTPFQMRQKAAGQELLITIQSVKQNTELPAGIFAVPEEVKALVK